MSLAGTLACQSASQAGLHIDLLHELNTAERRAAQPAHEAIQIAFPDEADAAALRMAAPARVTYSVRMPQRATFRSSVAVPPDSQGVTIRVGLSDDRLYDEVLRLPVPRSEAGSLTWTPIAIDLWAYSGRQWSVFYRPADVAWNLILNADPTPGGVVFWKRPMVDMMR